MPVFRVGARLIIRDPDGAVLLIQEHYRTPEGARAVHWLTPGGGVEAGESLAEAAVREAYEETGLRVSLSSLTAPVHTTRRLWNSATTAYDQEDHFFAIRVPARFEVAPGAATPEELTDTIGSRWWSLSELEATSELIVPADLSQLLHRPGWGA